MGSDRDICFKYTLFKLHLLKKPEVPMKANFQLFLLCLCAAVALVQCQDFDPVEAFDIMKGDAKVLTFKGMYGQTREQMKEMNPDLANQAIAEFDGIDTNENGEITLDEFKAQSGLN